MKMNLSRNNLLSIYVGLLMFLLKVNAQNGTFENRFGLTPRKGLLTIFQWKSLDWKYPSELQRQLAIQSGDFIPGTLVPIDVDVYYSGLPEIGNLVFMTVPRFQMGVPATLNTVNNDGLLTPYPTNWDWHTNPRACKNNRLVSVYRTMIDECGRLWVLDTGILGEELICSPQLLAFDLNTNKLIRKYEIPSDQYKPAGDSILVTPVVDVRDPKGTCYDTFVYIADVTENGLIVYDDARQTSWRVTSNLFYPYPPDGYFEIAGESFDLMDGILGMSLSPYIPGKDRTLFFHALASVTENRVSTSIIRNQTLFAEHADGAPRKFYLYPQTRPSQAAAEAIDRNGIQYFVLTKELALACWNIRNEYGGQNIHILEQNPETLQFGSGVKVITNRKDNQELWVITVRFQKVMTDTLSPLDVNFRIQAAKINDLVKGGRCQPNNYHNHNGGYGFPRSGHNQYLPVN